MQENEHDAPHSHPWHQLILAQTGSLRTRTENSEYFLPFNRALLIPAGTPHESWAVTRADFLGVYLDPQVLELTIESCEVYEISNLFRELLFHYAEQIQPLEKPNKQEQRLARVLVDLCSQQTPVRFDLALPSSKRVAPIVQALLAEPTNRELADAWAKRVGMSARSLDRLFQSESGQSFNQWRQRLSLYHSLALLEKGHPVKAVALDIGYRSPSAFIHRFKSEFGLTPLQYAASTSEKARTRPS